MTIEERLQELFPGYGSEARDAEWRAVRERLSVRDEVQGVVCFKSPFGAWIDIGCGFPALLLISRVANLTRDDYQRGAWCLEGSEITARIRVFANEKQVIGLTQL